MKGQLTYYLQSCCELSEQTQLMVVLNVNFINDNINVNLLNAVINEIYINAVINAVNNAVIDDVTYVLTYLRSQDST